MMNLSVIEDRRQESGVRITPDCLLSSVYSPFFAFRREFISKYTNPTIASTTITNTTIISELIMNLLTLARVAEASISV